MFILCAFVIQRVGPKSLLCWRKFFFSQNMIASDMMYVNMMGDPEPPGICKVKYWWCHNGYNSNKNH